MRLEYFLFGLLLAMCVVVGATMLIPETPYEEGADGERVSLAHGFPSERFPSMDVSGPGGPRHRPIVWLAWAFAVLQIIFVVVCYAFGVRRAGRAGPFTRPLLAGGLVLVGIVTMIFVAYVPFMTADQPTIVLSMPAPTAWYLCAFWAFGFFFVGLYVVLFRRWVVTDDDMTRFRAILAARDARDTPGADV